MESDKSLTIRIIFDRPFIETRGTLDTYKRLVLSVSIESSRENLQADLIYLSFAAVGVSPPRIKQKVDPDLSVSKLAVCNTPAVAAIKKYSMSPQNLQYRTIVGTIVGVIITNIAVLLRLLARRVGRLAL